MHRTVLPSLICHSDIKMYHVSQTSATSRKLPDDHCIQISQQTMARYWWQNVANSDAMHFCAKRSPALIFSSFDTDHVETADGKFADLHISRPPIWGQ